MEQASTPQELAYRTLNEVSDALGLSYRAVRPKKMPRQDGFSKASMSEQYKREVQRAPTPFGAGQPFNNEINDNNNKKHLVEQVNKLQQQLDELRKGLQDGE